MEIRRQLTVKKNDVLISLENICKYYNNSDVIKNVSYEFERNRCYVITGESGAGKSTLLNMIAGYDEVDRGEVSIKSKYDIQYMFQENLLFSNLTVLENIALKYYSTRQQLSWNLDELEHELSGMLSDIQISHLLHRKVGRLSLGEKQRVALAGILTTDFEILLLDEPIANIDKENADRILKIVNDLITGRTIIIITHTDIDSIDNIVSLELKDGGLHEKQQIR